MTVERYYELLDLFLDGEISESQIAELDQHLLSNPLHAKEAADRLREHRLLGLIYQSGSEADYSNAVMSSIEVAEQSQVDQIFSLLPIRQLKNDSKSAQFSSRIQSWVGLSLGLLIAVSLLSFFWQFSRWQYSQSGTQITQMDRSSAKQVGTVLLSENCRWADGTQIQEGQRLASGELRLHEGIAVIRLDGGAELILRGNVALDLISPGEAKLNRGQVVVRAEDEAEGFRLLTPATELIDLGTEFSVSVADAGETELNVLEGEVSIRPLKAKLNERKILPAGRAVIVENSHSQPREVTHKPERFATVVANAKPGGRADLMQVYDGFHYEVGVRPLKRTNRGKGWNGPWRVRSEFEGFNPAIDSNPTFDIVHGQMNVTWPVPGGQLGMLKFPAGKNFRIREMKEAIDLSTDGIYYFSLMVREPDYSKRTPQSEPQEGIRLTFRSTEDYYGECLSFGITHKIQPQLRTGQGVGFTSPATSPSNQTTLWIGKIIARANGEDEISFRIFGEEDELDYAEPSVWHVQTRGMSLTARLNLVVLTSLGVAPRIVDELRIGPTWRSVTPIKE